MTDAGTTVACGMGGCGSAPVGLYAWGLYPDGTHNNRVPLCGRHAAEAWEQVKGPVAAGLMHYAIEPCDPAPNSGGSQ